MTDTTEALFQDAGTPATDETHSSAPRVQELERLIDSGSFDLLSFDVFDTLVWRMIPTPRDVFYLVAGELRARGAFYDSSTIESFVKERIDAEVRARQKAPGGEVTLDEIYAEFPRGYLRGLSPLDLPRIEFEIERRLVHPNPAMVRLLSRAKAAGLMTALVSDTYFRRREIRALTGIEVDHVVLSCERRISKGRGLHRALIEESGVLAERILHVGDNYDADVKGPALFNLARFWFRKFPEGYGDLASSELPPGFGPRATLGIAHDAGVTSLRGLCMHQCETPHASWGAGVLGPIVAGYSDWVVGRCRELGIDRALCLMREGRILKRILDLSAAELDTREFFVSRFVALKSSIFDGSEDELRSFVFRPSPLPRGRIAAQLGLYPDDTKLGDPTELLMPDESLEMIRTIARDPGLRKQVVASSARARAGLIRHLEATIGRRFHGTVAVVDLGYRGTIQDCLQKIIDRERLGITTHGLYFVTGGDVHLTQARGCAVEGWLAENGQPIGMAHTFMRSPEIVEQSLMAPCGTTVGHTDSGQPILDDLLIGEDQLREMAEVQQGAMLYAKAWVEHKRTHGLGDTARLKPLHRAICIRSVARPLDVELKLFGHWRHDENFGSSSVRTLTTVTDLDEWERSHMSAHQLASLPHSRVYWPFGFARTVGRNVAEAVAHIYMRTVPPEAFDSGNPPRCFTFMWDEGGGFNAKTSSLQDFRLNHRGRVWHRISQRLERRTHRRYGFMLGAPGELLRLAGIVLHLRPERGVDSRVRFTPQDIELHGYQPLGQNLFRVAESPAWVEIPATAVTAFTGVVDVDLFFSLIEGT